MGLFDPPECVSARHALELGNARSAAEILLQSANPEHRVVRELLQKCHACLVREAEVAFDGGANAAARELWNLATQCAPPQGWTCVVGHRIETGEREPQPIPQNPQPNRVTVSHPHHQPLTQRQTRFAIGQRALVVSQSEICLGLAGHGEATVPIRGPLHRQHALLTRQGHQYWLAPFPGHSDRVAVNSRAIASFELLRDGDVLEMGNAVGTRVCRWRFLQTLTDSATAVLEADRCRVLTSSGREFDRVVLMADDWIIRPHPLAHLVWTDLPLDELRFRWTSSGLTWETFGGRGFIELPDGELESPAFPLHVPSRLCLMPEFHPAAQILGQFAGNPPSAGLTVELTNPFRPEK